jgi:Mn2+/Fe2+ NRAMP family transporter
VQYDGNEQDLMDFTVTTHMHAGRHLAEICKSEYPKFVRICLWILAEVAVIAADIPEGTR